MRTSLFRRAQRALALAEPALAIAPRALTRRAALTLGAAALAACAARSAPRRRESIAIIGAGAAGLVAAHRLADRADCAIYEASNRVGGRMFTQRNFTAEGQFCELGGELVDSGHKALIDLAGELGVGIQRIAPEGETDADLYAVGGKLYRASDMIDPATGAGAFAPIARRIAADQAALLDDDDNWTARAEALDRTSVKDYLNALRPEAERWAVDLLDRIERGAVLLDEQAAGRAARQRLQPQRARAGEQIGDSQAFEIAEAAQQHREQRFAGAIGGGARGIALGCDKLAPAPLAGDDPHARGPFGLPLPPLPFASSARKRSTGLPFSSTACPRGRSPRLNGP
mgnify:CR=1 FL=1